MPESSEGQLANHVIVCGLGHVGYRTVRLLMRLGQRGVVITRQLNEDWRRRIEPDFHVIVGDAQDDKLLLQAGITDAKAVLVVTDDDLANLSIALDARRMNPQAAVVVRQFDQDLAIHLEQSIEIDRALSASALAAPPFVAAVLGMAARCSFAVGDSVGNVGEHVIAEESSWKDCTLAQWSAGTGQVALAIFRGPQVSIPNQPDTPLQAGDHILTLCLTDDHSNGKSQSPSCLSRHSDSCLFRRLWTSIRRSWHEVPWALRVATIALLVIVVASIGVFRAALGLPFVDAFYFVVTMVTTVGFGDFNLMSASPSLKLYGAFVMLCGAAILATIFGITTDFILRTRLRDLFAHGAANYQNHIVVAGLGNIGFRLVRELVQAGERVVAIEKSSDASFLQTARELAPVVLGDAKTEETLRKAGIAGAKAVLAVTNDDLANLSTALAAKRIQPSCRTVLRIFNSELAEKMQQGLAMDAVLSVSGAAAPTFAGAAICPNVLQGFLFEDWLAVVFRNVVGDGGPEAKQAAAGTAEQSTILLVKHAGAKSYEAAASGYTPRLGDEPLGVRWFPLTDDRCKR